MDINRKQIMETFIRILTHLSDKCYQKRVWIRGEGPEVDDFDETVNFFADISDSILANSQDYGISDRQYKILKSFRNKFEAFWEENDWPAAFIDTPEWDQIIMFAKEVLKIFNCLNSRNDRST